MINSKFATVINCMDGRTQLPAIEFIAEEFGVQYVDTITEAGPVKILSNPDSHAKLIDSILSRLSISINKHGSSAVCIVAHHDCSGNPADKKIQLTQLEKSIEFIKNRFKETLIAGLWIDKKWRVNRKY